MEALKIADEIISGRRLKREDNLNFLLEANLNALCEGANKIREALCKKHVDLCSIINGRAGRCSENCKFCSQSSFHHTACEKYDMLEAEVVLEDCKKREAAGVHAYSVVTAGRDVTGKDLEKLTSIYNTLKKECPSMRLCASSGLLTEDALKKLKDAGCSMYHENIETSKRNFSNVCTTHTYEDKVKVIKLAKKVGLSVCSGGIIGMGETWEDRLDMAVSLAELKIDSIPINALIPVKGTFFEKLTPLTEEEILRSVALFRYLNPTAYIRMAAGRNYFKNGGRRLFESGVNATITGDMLTTVGNNTAEDRAMLKEMGFEL